jgi:hypothetical protein
MPRPLTAADRVPQMGDRISPASADMSHPTYHRGFLCHVDKDGVRLVCNEGGSEEWLGGFLSVKNREECVYRYRRDGGPLTTDEA